MCLHKAGVPTFICFQAYLSTANVICLFIATANVFMCVCVSVWCLMYIPVCAYMCVTQTVRLCFYNSSIYNKFMSFTGKEIEIKT